MHPGECERKARKRLELERECEREWVRLLFLDGVRV